MSEQIPADSGSGGPESLRPHPGGAPASGFVEPAAGTLLVATPELGDPSFRRTVVYLLAHGDDGSVGLIINRRTETAVHNVLPGWHERVCTPRALFAGGPVQTSGAMCLGVSRLGVSPADLSGVVGIAGSVVLVDLDAEPEHISAGLQGLRIFAGHAGWGVGQLAGEIKEGAWTVVPSRPTDILEGAGVDLWFRVLKRQPFPLAWQAWMPAEAQSN